jgi:hypothetical protein
VRVDDANFSALRDLEGHAAAGGEVVEGERHQQYLAA